MTNDSDKPSSGNSHLARGGAADPAARDALADSQPSGNFFSADLPFWQQKSHDERKAYVDDLSKRYNFLLEDFLEAKESCESLTQKFSVHSQRWRLGLILGAGFLALFNIVVSKTDVFVSGDPQLLTRILSFIAALLAASLGVAHSLESHFNYSQHLKVNQESREYFFDAYRDFELRWVTRVLPFGYSPQSCVNAADLYRLIIQEEKRLRFKLLQRSQTQQEGKDDP